MAWGARLGAVEATATRNGWARTEASGGGAPARLFGCDCEMVGLKGGVSALARVSVVEVRRRCECRCRCCARELPKKVFAQAHTLCARCAMGAGDEATGLKRASPAVGDAKAMNPPTIWPVLAVRLCQSLRLPTHTHTHAHTKNRIKLTPKTTYADTIALLARIRSSTGQLTHTSRSAHAARSTRARQVIAG